MISNSTINYNSFDTLLTGTCILALSGNPVITSNVFNGAYASDGGSDISVESGSPSITNNTFAGAYSSTEGNGILIDSGSPQISGNQFQGGGELTAILDGASSPITISNNVFTNCVAGVTVKTGSVLTIQGNSFLRGTDGIDIASGAQVTITGNLIDGNRNFGIHGGAADVTLNTITNNQVGST